VKAVFVMERISEIVLRAIDAISERGYGVTTQRKRRYSFLRILRLHEQHGTENYDESLVKGYLIECGERFRRGEIAWERYRELTKAAEQLGQIRETDTIASSKRTFAPAFPDYYAYLHGVLADETGWSQKKRLEIRYVMNRFFDWLISHGHNDLSLVDEKVLRRYLIYCSGYLTGSSLDTVRRSIQNAFVRFYTVGIIPDSYEKIFSFTVPIEKKIRPGIPHSEIAATLKMVDRNTIIGKRDFAMILIGVVTGLRAIDIAGLEIGELDWSSGEIRLNQSKTGKSLALPLTTDVGKAVRDYILNARPVCETKKVFLSTHAPIGGISSKNVTRMHNQYRLKAGLPKSGIHGLRRALGSGMVSAFVPVTTIMQVLGQTGLNSTKPYMPLNSAQLKECALDFSGIEPNISKLGNRDGNRGGAK
jgi:integrase